MSEVKVYMREGCHLCDQALAVIERVRARHGFALELIDIESDDALMLAYLERIPVVAVDGQERFQFFVDEPGLIRALGIVSAP
ncbi:MAG: glutaredoxin family protein [Solirubrobacterales bacterium]|nr:glutaredoxin family protein [Solirubrobacterales bacterium]